MATRAKTEIYIKDFPGQLRLLRQVAGESEPDLVFGLWVLLSRNGLKLNWGDTEVVSGQALQIAYSRDPRKTVEVNTVPPLDALSRSFGVTWTEITPSSSLRAFDIGREWIDQGVLFLAKLRQPMLIYGYDRDSFETRLKVLRLGHKLPNQTMSGLECDAHDWKLQLDDGNSLLRVDYIETPDPDWMALLPVVVRRTIANWRHESIDGVDFGLTAYRNFAEDLRNPDVDFVRDDPPSWMGPLLYRQIHSRTHVYQFLDRLAPRYGGKPRQVLAKASTNFGQAAASWQEFGRHLGRVYERREQGKSLRGPDTNVHHWRDARRRQEAAKMVDQAALWEGRAIAELAKLLGT